MGEVINIMKKLRKARDSNSEPWIIDPADRNHGLSYMPVVGDYSQHENIRAMQKNLLLDVVAEMAHLQQNSSSDVTLSQNVQGSKNYLSEAYLQAMPVGSRERETRARNFANADEQAMRSYLDEHPQELQAAGRELGVSPTALVSESSASKSVVRLNAEQKVQLIKLASAPIPPSIGDQDREARRLVLEAAKSFKGDTLNELLQEVRKRNSNSDMYAQQQVLGKADVLASGLFFQAESMRSAAI